jgi:SAM-dependent methyltransferase
MNLPARELRLQSPPSHRRDSWTDEDVRSFWDEAAGLYERENARVRDTHFQRFSVARRLLAIEPGQDLLNVWCRNGEAIDYLAPAENGIRMVNAELSWNMLDLARSARPGHLYVQIESLASLPLRSAAFDRVLSLETLEHCPRPIDFLRELHRVARPGARLVLSCPPAAAEPAYRVYSRFLGGHGEGPHRFLASREVKQLLARAGWTLRLHRSTLLVPAGPRWLRAMGEKLLTWLRNTPVAELGIRHFYVCEKPGAGEVGE